MNVNGSRFQLLLGKADWGTCTGPDQSLGAYWTPDADSPEVAVPHNTLPSWDEESDRLSLSQLVEELPATAGEAPVSVSDRRAAAVDRFGNVYAISESRLAIDVTPPDNGGIASIFWPDARTRPVAPQNPFTDASPPAEVIGTFTALAITCEHFLVAAFVTEGRTGLLRFDLVGGGAPEAFALDAEFPNPVADMAPDDMGGLWLLETATPSLFRLDRGLQPLRVTQPVIEPDAFQPVGPLAERTHPVASEKFSVAFDLNRHPVQIIAGENGEIFVLAHRIPPTFAADEIRSVFYAIHPGSNSLDEIGFDEKSWVMFAYGPTGPFGTDTKACLVTVPSTGNQAMAFAIERDPSGHATALVARPWLLPMRRFGGRGLLYREPQIVYDCIYPRDGWIPLARQPRRQFASTNTFQSRVFDSAVPQCLWDRIRLDACIPSGTRIRFWARAADDEILFDGMAEQDWIEQPLPYLNTDGGELPGKGARAALHTDRQHGTGCWDLLLQNAVGRYAQLKIELTGDRRNSPMLRALRIWYPRFSYTERFLPTLYREDTASANFLDRFLASMEGVNSVIEGKIASAQMLFDTRCASPEMLEWLSSWFDVALDVSWTEARRRIFLRNAVTFFGWRGTMAGMLLALRLAFDDTLGDADFKFGARPCTGPGTIRIVEAFSTARFSALRPAQSTLPLSGPGWTSLESDWTPAEGGSGLFARLQRPATGRFPLFVDPETDGAEAAIMFNAFGFSPVMGAMERHLWRDYQQANRPANDADRPLVDVPVDTVPEAISALWIGYLALKSKIREQWQNYLEQRHRRIEMLNQSYQSNWRSFAEIPIPDHVPEGEQAIMDWLLFEGQLLPRQNAAHRFSVLLPVKSVNQSQAELEAAMALAMRIVAIEKPAHTICDVRFYWAMNRVGEARIGSDTELGAGSRAPELIPPAILGQTYLGSSFVGGPQGRVEKRERLAC
jgi:phage tail-like protein